MASWPGGYSYGSSAVSTDRSCGDLVERNCHVVSNRPVALNGPLRRPHPSASFWGPVSPLKARAVVVVPGWSSSVPDLSVGLKQAILVQFEVIAVSFVDLTVVYQQLHAADTTSMLSCNVRDNDTYCAASSESAR